MLARLSNRAKAFAALALIALFAALPINVTVTPHYDASAGPASMALELPSFDFDVGLSEASAQTAMGHHPQNKIIDATFRGQSITFPATVYIGLSTTACNDSSFGTEVSTSGTGYARAAVAASLTNFAGTQAAGSTTASSNTTGTSGTTSNNNAIPFPTPLTSWGTVSHWFIADAATAGNLWFCAPLSATKVINAGDTVSFASGALTVTLARLELRMREWMVAWVQAANDDLFEVAA